MRKIVFIAALFSSLAALGQDLPKASPKAKIEQRVGLTDFKIEYHRPSVKGRTVFGDLVPYNEVWRAGANEATLITISDDVKIEGKTLKASTYALYFTPTDSIWKVHFNSKTDSWGASDYDSKNDVLVLEITPVVYGPKTNKKNNQVQKEGKNGPTPQGASQQRQMNPILKRSYNETLEYSFSNVTDSTANMTLSWDLTKVVMKVEVDVYKKAMENIEKALKETEKENLWKVYRNAANYMLQNKKDNNKGIEWINKSIELYSNNWYSHWVKAQLLHAEGKDKEADKSVEQAIKLGEEDAKSKKTTFQYKETLEKETANWK